MYAYSTIYQQSLALGSGHLSGCNNIENDLNILLISSSVASIPKYNTSKGL